MSETEQVGAANRRSRAPWIIGAVVVLLLVAGGTLFVLRDSIWGPSKQSEALNAPVMVEQDAGAGASARPQAQVNVKELGRWVVAGGEMYTPSPDEIARVQQWWVAYVRIDGSAGPFVAQQADWTLIDSSGYSHTPATLTQLNRQLLRTQAVSPGEAIEFRIPFDAPEGRVTLQLNSGGQIYQWTSA